MSKQSSAALIIPESNTKCHVKEVHIESEQNQQLTNFNLIKLGNLLKFRHKLRKLEKEALTGYSDQLRAIKSACVETNALLGDLNEKHGGKRD